MPCNLSPCIHGLPQRVQDPEQAAAPEKSLDMSAGMPWVLSPVLSCPGPTVAGVVALGTHEWNWVLGAVLPVSAAEVQEGGAPVTFYPQPLATWTPPWPNRGRA